MKVEELGEGEQLDSGARGDPRLYASQSWRSGSRLRADGNVYCISIIMLESQS